MISETPTRPQVFCSGRGRMLEDGYCECSPLFHGKDCDVCNVQTLMKFHIGSNSYSLE